MYSLDLSLQKPLEDYVTFLETLTARSVALLDKFADSALAFQDPVHNVRGRDAAQQILRRRFEIFPSGKYEVNDFFWGRRPSTAYMRWTFSYNTKGGILTRSERLNIDGLTEIGFSPAAKICTHQEFWSDMALFESKGYRKPL